MSEEKILVVGLSESRGLPSSSGSKLYECNWCLHRLWLAPTSQEVARRGDCVLICSDCFERVYNTLLRRFPIIDIIDISDEQLDEIERNTGHRPSKEETRAAMLSLLAKLTILKG